MLEGRRREAELTMGMFADLPAFEISHTAERVELPYRAHPIGTETEIVTAPAFNQPIGIGLTPQSLIDTKRHLHALLQVQHVLDRIDADRSFGEVDAISLMPALQ